MSNVQWFYADARQQQQGPVTFEQLQQLAATGQIQPATLIWNEGMPSWTAASQVSGVFNAGPPPVTAAPASSINPYTSPTPGFPGAFPPGGHYPIPHVKKSSFGLFLLTYLIGLVLLLGGFVILAAKTVELVTVPTTESQPLLETREDVAEWEAQQTREIERRLEDNFIKDPPIASVGLILIGWLTLVISSILGLIALYRAWFVLQPGGARTTPGKAVGFLFIPLFNLYWVFEAYHGWSQDWNRIQASHGNLSHMPRVSSGFFLTTLILGICSVIAIFIPLLNLLFLIGVPILYLLMFFQIYRVVNAMAAANHSR